MSKCKFYEVDIEAKNEAEAADAAYLASLRDTEREAIKPWKNSVSFDKCGEYCKFLEYSSGYPGEYLYNCTVPGNEHIIHADFYENEVK
jgi:hypothetical protein